MPLILHPGSQHFQSASGVHQYAALITMSDEIAPSGVVADISNNPSIVVSLD